MNPLKAAALALLVAAALPAIGGARGGEPTLAIVNVTVIDAAGARPKPGMTVLVEESRIADIVPAGRAVIPDGTLVLKADGKFLIPALWDMHAHIANTPNSSLTTDVLLPMFTAYGVVGVRDMGGDLDRILRARIDIRQRRVEGPLIITPGPFVDGPQPKTAIVMPVTIEDEGRAAVRTLVERGVDFIKIQSGLSLENWRAIGREAKRRNIVFAGHVPEAISASDVIGSGQASIEHASPALPGDAGLLLACSSKEAELRQELLALNVAAKEPNADRAALRARQDKLQLAMFETYDAARGTALFRRMLKDKVALVPTLIWSQTLLPRTREDRAADVPIQAIPAVIRARWAETRRRYIEAASDERLAHNAKLAQQSIDFVRRVHEVGVTVLAGTDSFDAFVVPGYSLHQELELLVSAGFSTMSALQSATRDPARFFGQEKERGTVEKGKVADLLVLDADPLADIRNTRRIAALIKSGDLMTRTDLNALLPNR